MCASVRIRTDTTLDQDSVLMKATVQVCTACMDVSGLTTCMNFITFVFFGKIHFYFFSSLQVKGNAGRDTLATPTNQPTNQSFRVCKVNVATLKFANHQHLYANVRAHAMVHGFGPRCVTDLAPNWSDLFQGHVPN